MTPAINPFPITESEMTAQETLDALDEAGRLLAPILDAERGDAARTPSLSLSGNDFQVSAFVDKHYKHHVTGFGETLSAAFVHFLANRSDKLAEIEREAELKREFEAFKAQQVAA